MSNEALIEMQDICLEFPTADGVVKALDNVSLHVDEGEVVGLVGESGSGKSVSAMLAMRLLPEGSYRVTNGDIKVLGKHVLELTDKEIEAMRGAQISMVFQEPMNALNPTIKVGKQLVAAIRRHQKISKKDATNLAIDLLREMQINDAAAVMQSYSHSLSGGMRQRILLAMAFSSDPQVLIADEPTTALDVTVQAQILDLFTHKAKKNNTAVLFVSHDLGVVRHLCDRIYVMYAGKILEAGSTEDVLTNPQHPYTQALLSSLPERNQRKQPIPTIEGIVPSLLNPPSGCRFKTRCTHAVPKCDQQPVFSKVPVERSEPTKARDHWSACWLTAVGEQ